ncbi:hypothetical protein NQ315_017229 [Exocentrus adspersus]|uniref:Uncharacterized protein n=1 Tax=Exocentrus adspersus TaxID=1586481 RepID=A0AAV8V6W5_9CUCU|nr:hypothetical protein NQ315_017229 [Exocentrus adspersus]
MLLLYPSQKDLDEEGPSTTVHVNSTAKSSAALEKESINCRDRSQVHVNSIPVQVPPTQSHLDDITTMDITPPPLPPINNESNMDPTDIRREIDLDVNRRRDIGNHPETYLLAHERILRFGPSYLGPLNRVCEHCNAKYFTAEMTIDHVHDFS